MVNEWADRLPWDQASELWMRMQHEQRERQAAIIQGQLEFQFEKELISLEGVYEAMAAFIKLRKVLFPGLPADPALAILATIGATPEGSSKLTITGVTYGANVPNTTALRYLSIMEQQGLIERVPHPIDARQILIRLTPDGKQRLRALADRWISRIGWLAFPAATLLLAGGAIAAMLTN